MSDPASYTVGWICAILTEYIAAQEFLDEEHHPPKSVSPNDTNNYTLGKIGEHNVVIAVLPFAGYGTSSAANVAANMLNSFPNVRIGLMVGIGGGVPSDKHDIRLGDVVVSVPRDGDGGVFQYDFGKAIQGQGFQHTKFLNQPPIALRTAIMGIQAQYTRKGHRLQENIKNIFDKNPRLRKEYEQPQPSTDRLFKPEVIHDLRGCAEFCAANSLNIIHRRERSETDDNPVIHYGLIASANHLMKDALIRDRLAKEKDVLCFEMEAAGLMNEFPCLVIRGICDYSDSHKNKDWQGYASMVAAAFAKDLLGKIPPSRVETEKKIGDLSDLIKVADKHRVIAEKQLEIQQDIAQQKLTEEQQECLRMFRLTTGTGDATYEWYKHHAGSRVEGTCEWFLNHENFRKWLEQDSGPLLVSADPGCGKSVLARYLIDEGLPRSATICYFFFKDQDQNTVGQALCALLHQLFSQKPALIHHAMDDFRADGKTLIKSTISMWEVFNKATQDPRAGPLIIVLDALDECAPSEFEDLVHNLESQLCSGESLRNKLKFLLTSRPYGQILDRFRGLMDAFPSIRIPGEQESESISQEVNHVVQYRVQQLAKEKGLTEVFKNHIMERLLEVPHRTYLWVYLVFDYLKTEYFKKTPKGFDSAIATLPTSIYEAYERILGRSKGPMVLKALSIILAASRPLTVSEMNVALNVHHTSKSLRDLDLEEEDEFVLSLRTWCGLFISIHHGKIYFLHQTAREFLLADAAPPLPPPSGTTWQHSISSQSAHNVLACVCVIYLDFLNDDSATWEIRENSVLDGLDEYTFLEYSAKNWSTHYRKACLGADADILSHTLNICNPGSKSYSAWIRIYRTAQRSPSPGGPRPFISLIIASHLGLDSVVNALLEKAVDFESINERDEDWKRSALSWAAANDNQTIVQLLLDKGAYTESKDYNDRTPLSWAAAQGNEAIVQLLLEKGACVDSKDSDGRTPLSRAAENGHKMIVVLLLERGAYIESQDRWNRTPLFRAIANNNETIARALLEKGAYVNSKDYEGQTPLSWTAAQGNETVARLLLEKGAYIDSKDYDNRTPLSRAAGNGHKMIVLLLLEKGAYIDSKDYDNRTPLSRAAGNGHKMIVLLLLEKGAYIESKDYDNRTPLGWAVVSDNETTVRLLLEKGADTESKDRWDRTPLFWGVGNGSETIVRALLEKGAHVDLKDCDDQTPLLWAAGKDKATVTIVQALLEEGADIEAKDASGRTLLSIATKDRQKSIVGLLLERGADIESKDESNWTPLWFAVKEGDEAIVALLLKSGADIESKDDIYQTPLFLAVEHGHEAIVQLLLEHHADFKARDKWSQTPLSIAVEAGNHGVTELLLKKGAIFDLNDATLLSLIVQNRHGGINELLLQSGIVFDPKDPRPLCHAADWGHTTIAELLLDKGADPNVQDTDGCTPLLCAVKNNYHTIAQLLLGKGADSGSPDHVYGRTPLSWAAMYGQESVVKMLLERGADMESRDVEWERTPLCWAAVYGREMVVKLLLDSGADMESKDGKWGRTPLSWAAQNSHKTIVRLLLERGAHCESSDMPSID